MACSINDHFYIQENRYRGDLAQKMWGLGPKRPQFFEAFSEPYNVLKNNPI
jgi:hypothetical protein